MSNYTQVTFFAPKDALLSGDPNKIIHGTQVDPELAAIATAIASKFDVANMGSIPQLAIGSGTAGAPSYSFASDTTTGWYLSAVGVLAAATSGVQRGTIGSSGNWTLNAPASGDALTTTAVAGGFAATFNGAATIGSSKGINVVLVASANASDIAINASKPGHTLLSVAGDGSFQLGNNGSGVSTITGAAAGNVTIAAPTSGTSLIVNVAAGGNAITSTDGTVSALVAGFGGTQLNIGALSNHALALVTNTSTRVLVAAAGNVTVNAPSSGIAVTINGITGNQALQYTDGTRTGALLVQNVAGNEVQIGSVSNHGFSIFTNGSARFAISNVGNVTINAPGSAKALIVNGASGDFAAQLLGNSASGNSFGLSILAGTTSADAAIAVGNQANTATFLKIFGDGHGTLGPNTTNDLSWNTAGNFTVNAPTSGTSLTISSATSDDGMVFNNTTANGGRFTIQASGSAYGFIGSSKSIISGTLTNTALAIVSTNLLNLAGNGSSTPIVQINGTTGPTVQGYGPVNAGLVDMTPDQSSWSATLSGGFTANPNGTLNWQRIGNHVEIFATADITGTSNGTNDISVSGVPAAITPTHAKTVIGALIVNNSIVGAAAVTINTNNTLTLQILTGGATVQVATSGWTNANSKGIKAGFSVSYSLG